MEPRIVQFLGRILVVVVNLTVFVLVCLPTFAEAESTPGCGKIDQALLKKDKRVAVPWAATIFYQSTQCDFRVGPFGHGVIIGPTSILMSGNFLWGSTVQDREKLLEFKPSHFMVAVGLKSKQPLSADDYTQFIKVSHIRVHPKSYEKYSEDDFAIFHLANSIRFSSYVRPICLENSPETSLNDFNSTYKLGDLSISGYRRGQPDTEPFGLLDPTVCKSKLETEYQDIPQSADLNRLKTPCGFSSKSRDETQNWGGYGNGLIQARFMDFSQMARLNNNQIVPNICYQKGSSIVSFYNDRYHLVGLSTESFGTSCTNVAYFLSFVTMKKNIDWILKNVWFSSQGFVCNDGQTVDRRSKACDGFEDCDDASDENYCVKCDSFFSMYCSRCPESDSFKILRNTYNFSTTTSSEEVKCPGLTQPQGSLLHCENPNVRSRISCAYGSEPGTKAIFQCKTAKPNEPSSYCVITCKDDGTWTDELKGYNCGQMNSKDVPNKGQVSISNIIFGDGKNLTSWINSVLQSYNKTNNSNIDDMSLENWTPSTIGVIGDKTGLNPIGHRKCFGFKKTSGLKITCRSPNSSELTDCSQMAEPGTKAEFGCEKYYRPIFSAASVTKTCMPGGRWSLENRAFECRLDCGVPKTALVGHIVHGQVTEGAKWPWHAIIFRKTKDNKLLYICGATLISKRLILTAAHCVTNSQGEVLSPDNFLVVLGATSNILEDNYGDPNSQIIKLTNITVNQAFNLASFESDIAIIRLETPSNVSDYVRPACFPSTLTSHNELIHLTPGSEGQIIGFGYDESGNPSTKLKEASLPVVSYPDCYQVLKIQASSTMYCAGFTNGTAACNGDSGGGMFFEDEVHPRRMYLQGIVSHGNRDKTTGLCDHNQYSVFTKVASFKNWIYEIGPELDEEL